MLEEQHEVLFLAIDIVHNHHAHIQHVFAHSVEPLVSESGWQEAVAFLLTDWAGEHKFLFVHLDVAVGVDGVEARRDEAVRLALLAINDPADAFVPVGEISQVHQLIVGLASLIADEAQLLFLMDLFLVLFANNCLLLSSLFFWVVSDSQELLDVAQLGCQFIFLPFSFVNPHLLQFIRKSLVRSSTHFVVHYQAHQIHAPYITGLEDLPFLPIFLASPEGLFPFRLHLFQQIQPSEQLHE